ncbi:hypothetical protein HKX48_007327 [Thoreauomyces humboldtii]|nr:hypothetical protein HKX48_007327 [Thoreauomyces humboldtii]
MEPAGSLEDHFTDFDAPPFLCDLSQPASKAFILKRYVPRLRCSPSTVPGIRGPTDSWTDILEAYVNDSWVTKKRLQKPLLSDLLDAYLDDPYPRHRSVYSFLFHIDPLQMLGTAVRNGVWLTLPGEGSYRCGSNTSGQTFALDKPTGLVHCGGDSTTCIAVAAVKPMLATSCVPCDATSPAQQWNRPDANTIALSGSVFVLADFGNSAAEGHAIIVAPAAAAQNKNGEVINLMLPNHGAGQSCIRTSSAKTFKNCLVSPAIAASAPATEIRLRQAEDCDFAALGRLASVTFKHTAINRFRNPWDQRFPDDAIRARTQRLYSRVLSPRNVSILAYHPSQPSVPIGYIQFLRLGNDSKAKAQIASRASWSLTLRSWFYWAWYKVVNFVRPDRSIHAKNVDLFTAFAAQDAETHWSPEKFPERQDRWHVQSVAVDEKWQGKGIGKLLMGEVFDRARADDVPVGLESTPAGEGLYLRLGFELLARLALALPGDEESGGIMMWTPKGWEGRHVKTR